MIRFLLIACIISLLAMPSAAHEPGKAHYIANEGLLITQGDTKILFDPFSASGFGTYAEPTEAVVKAMMTAQPPFDGVDAVFISHAHGDHFDADDMIAYLTAQPTTKLIAPMQAIELMQKDPQWDEALSPRITSINMDYGQAPQTLTFGDITATAVRIPHAGWPAPRRASVQNMVYRVTLGDKTTVMHMGDADVNPDHYTPFTTHWKALRTQTGFPPYWFLGSEKGQTILKDINISHAIGIHVPIIVPNDLKISGTDYFSVAGETRTIK